MDAYRLATGCPQTSLNEIVSGYRTFTQTVDRVDMRAGTYDKLMSRFSAIWPNGVAWPEGVERPEPAVLDAQTIKLMNDTRRAVSGIHPEWPADEQWPSDIPKPVAATKATTNVMEI